MNGKFLKIRRSRKKPNRDALSLLEVLLSIAILGGAMAVISQFMYLGFRNAQRARLQSDATIICDSLMAEVAAGIIPPETSAGNDVPGFPDWQYAVDVDSSDVPGLLLTTVRVIQKSNQRTTMSIVRFVPDPDYEPEDPR